MRVLSMLRCPFSSFGDICIAFLRFDAFISEMSLWNQSFTKRCILLTPDHKYRVHVLSIATAVASSVAAYATSTTINTFILFCLKIDLRYILLSFRHSNTVE